MPHALGQLSLSATTTETAYCNYWACVPQQRHRIAKKYINAIFIKYIFMFINYESCHVGPPRGMSHGGESWQNVIHWRREWQTTLVFLSWDPHEPYEKAKRQDTERWNPQVGRCTMCYWRLWRNNSRKNKEMEPKQKQHPVVDVTGEGTKVWWCRK